MDDDDDIPWAVRLEGALKTITDKPTGKTQELQKATCSSKKDTADVPLTALLEHFSQGTQDNISEMTTSTDKNIDEMSWVARLNFEEPSWIDKTQQVIEKSSRKRSSDGYSDILTCSRLLQPDEEEVIYVETLSIDHKNDKPKSSLSGCINISSTLNKKIESVTTALSAQSSIVKTPLNLGVDNSSQQVPSDKDRCLDMASHDCATDTDNANRDFFNFINSQGNSNKRKSHLDETINELGKKSRSFSPNSVESHLLDSDTSVTSISPSSLINGASERSSSSIPINETNMFAQDPTTNPSFRAIEVSSYLQSMEFLSSATGNQDNSNRCTQSNIDNVQGCEWLSNVAKNQLYSNGQVPYPSGQPSAMIQHGTGGFPHMLSGSSMNIFPHMPTPSSSNMFYQNPATISNISPLSRPSSSHERLLTPVEYPVGFESSISQQSQYPVGPSSSQQLAYPAGLEPLPSHQAPYPVGLGSSTNQQVSYPDGLGPSSRQQVTYPGGLGPPTSQQVSFPVALGPSSSQQVTYSGGLRPATSQQVSYPPGLGPTSNQQVAYPVGLGSTTSQVPQGQFSQQSLISSYTQSQSALSQEKPVEYPTGLGNSTSSQVHQMQLPMQAMQSQFPMYPHKMPVVPGYYTKMTSMTPISMVLNQCQGAKLPIVPYSSEYPGPMTSKQMPINILPSYPQSMLPNIQNPMRYPGIPISIRPDQIQAKNMVPAQPILSKTMDYRQVSPIMALQKELQKEIMTRSDSPAQQQLAQPRLSKVQMECQKVIPMMPIISAGVSPEVLEELSVNEEKTPHKETQVEVHTLFDGLLVKAKGLFTFEERFYPIKRQTDLASLPNADFNIMVPMLKRFDPNGEDTKSLLYPVFMKHVKEIREDFNYNSNVNHLILADSLLYAFNHKKLTNTKMLRLEHMTLSR
uniref:Uncharacterized protein n=1 Tax=Acrobeloides nanus TaxID=290746 RepID=A0A914D4T8_9BILA